MVGPVEVGGIPVGLQQLSVLEPKIVTPLKINMEPKNEGLEDDFPLQTGDFQVPC